MSGIRCAKCGAECAEGARFCTECGSRMSSSGIDPRVTAINNLLLLGIALLLLALVMQGV